MYIKGVSTREAEAVMRQFGVVCLSSSQVSRATRLLDEELEAWAAAAPSGRSAISSSMPAPRRCASAAWCAPGRAGRRRMAAPRSGSASGSASGKVQFHLAQNAIHHAPNVAIRKRIGTELRAVWNAPDLPKAEAAPAELVASCRDAAPKLAKWLEENVPEGLTVFALPADFRNTGQRLR